jgi:hypothetical protein
MCIAKKHPKNAESERPNGAKAKTDHPNVPVAPSSSNPDEEPTNFEVIIFSCFSITPQCF